MPTLCDPCLTAALGVPQGSCPVGTLSPVFCFNGAPQVCIPDAALACPPVATNLVAQGIPCTDDRGAPVYCTAAGGSVLRTLPMPCQGSGTSAGLSGDFGGAVVPPSPGLNSPPLIIPGFTNTGCYPARLSFTILGTFNAIIPGGSELTYWMELDGVPQRFVYERAQTSAVARNFYETYTYPDTMFIAPGASTLPQTLTWHWELTGGLGAFLFTWTQDIRYGAYRAMPLC